ncbi:uncharacterized protein LOC115232686 isoform X2 [Octopus sinensis]|uniref:Uncharacterized protein LOC115232686 isoform X2 n=1 Tax=Octopus sinensis TaxID=2607531 RepID=A0A6P7UB32_9MOLL|nr:uncharacterized protein LOC115232686 isoform X2 [Octopus sinensis]
MASKCRRILALKEKEESSFHQSRSRAKNRKIYSHRSLSLSSRIGRPDYGTIHEEEEDLPQSTLIGKRSRSLASLVRYSSRKSVHNLVKMFETMTEGRKTQVILLDENRLDITIQPKLYTKDLLDLVASHLNLKEKEYFGLYYLDEKGNTFWLHLDKKVLDHDFSRRSLLLLYLGIKFYVESIAHLRDKPAIELFYLNAKQAIYKGLLECNSETVFELAAYVLQITYGNFTTVENAREDLKKLYVVPTRTLQEHPSLGYCEERVLFHYQKIEGTSRGLSIVNYMTICESLPTYGIHYYEVKDKKDIPWWLGISHRGISVYDKTDKQTPRKIFHWKQLENLYYREKKFSVEVHDPKRIIHTLSSFNLYEDALLEPIDEFDALSDAISDPTTQVSVSRRTFGPGNVNVHAWFSSSPHLTKCIWSMAVDQHRFCLDRRDNKSYLQTARSMSEIVAELSQSSTSLSGSGASDLSRSTSSHSLPSLFSTSRYDVNIDPVKVKKEMYQALKDRRDALIETLKKKNEEFKQLCIQEGELIGHLPKDTPMAPGEQPPTIRRRVRTAFSLSSKLVPKDGDNMENELSCLELEYELQSKITSAANKLAHDPSVSKQVRKQRKQSYQKAETKLKEMEKKLNEMRKKAGHSTLKVSPVYQDPSEDSLGPTTDSEPEMISPVPSPVPHSKRDCSHVAFTNNVDNPEIIPDEEVTSCLPPDSPSSHLSPSHSSPQLTGGYTPSSVYSTGTQYRNQRYPTFSNRLGQSGREDIVDCSKFDGSHDSGFSSANNMTQVTPGQRPPQCENGEVKTPTNIHPYEYVQAEFQRQMTLTPNIEENYCSPDNSLISQRPRGPVSKPGNILPQLFSSKYGSRRESDSDYIEEVPESSLDIHNNSVASEPVYSHLGTHAELRWEDTQMAEPSPIIRSPQKSYDDLDNRPNTPSTEHSYSPRVYEYQSPPAQEVQVIHITGNTGPVDKPEVDPVIVTPPPNSRLVTTITKIKPQIEVSKPFETSDFFKYSEKLRRARMLDSYQRQLMGVTYQTEPSIESFYNRSCTPEHSNPPSPAFFPRMMQPAPSSPFVSQHHSLQQQQQQSTPSHFPSYWRDFEQHSGNSSPVSMFASKRGDINSSQTSSFHQQQSNSSSSSSSSSTYVQYSSQSVSRTVFRSHQIQTTRHAHYKPPQPMTCEPVVVPDLQSPSSHTPVNQTNMTNVSSNTSMPSSSSESTIKSRDNSFTLNAGESLAEAFSEEMLAWYEDQESSKKHPTLV